MEKLRKYLSQASGLVMVSVVLVVAIVALFMSNVGYGWMASLKDVDANGLIANVNNPGSPVYDYELYYVYDAKVKTKVNNQGHEEMYNEYYFKALGIDETAIIELKNYSKLEAPEYHLLLHVSVTKETVGNLYVDLHIQEPSGSKAGTYGNNQYTIQTSQLPSLTQFGALPLGLSSALEFYVLGSSAGIVWEKDHQLFNEDGEEYARSDVFVLRSDMLAKEGTTYKMTDNKTTLTFEGVQATADNGLTTTTTDLHDVPGYCLPGVEATDAGDGYLDLFIFMTYSADLVATLQAYGSVGVDSNDQGTFGFLSDIFLLIRKDY